MRISKADKEKKVSYIRRLLSENPNLKRADIAKMASCSLRLVQEVAKSGQASLPIKCPQMDKCKNKGRGCDDIGDFDYLHCKTFDERESVKSNIAQPDEEDDEGKVTFPDVAKAMDVAEGVVQNDDTSDEDDDVIAEEPPKSFLQHGYDMFPHAYNVICEHRDWCIKNKRKFEAAYWDAAKNEMEKLV